MDSYYLQQILSAINKIYGLLEPLSSNVNNILIAVVFFGFLFVAFNFISKRWLTL